MKVSSFGVLSIVGIGGAVILASGLVWYLFFASKRPHFDELTLRVFENVALVKTYRQEVTTDTDISSRHLHIVGLYDIDSENSRFATYSTTTLTIPDMPEATRDHTFTLKNIAVGNDVFTHIQTDSSLLKKTVPYSPDWRHFKNDTIPEEFVNIAVPGPILDNLALFRDKGAYLVPTGPANEVVRDGMTLQHYTFTIAGDAARNSYGSLAALVEHINTGTVEVWVDAETATIRFLEFKSEVYQSLTKITLINEGITIEPPSDFTDTLQ